MDVAAPPATAGNAPTLSAANGLQSVAIHRSPPSHRSPNGFPQPSPSSGDSGGMQIPLGDRRIDLLALLRRRYSLVLVGLFTGLAASALYLSTASSQYRSSIEVLVGQRTSEATSTGQLSGGQAGDGMGEDQLATHMRLFIAPKVLAAAVNIGDLEQYPGLADVKLAGESMIETIASNLRVDRGGDEKAAAAAMVLRAQYTSEDAQESAAVLSAVYESYKRYTEHQGDDSTELAVQLIDDAGQTHEIELREAEKAYREYVASMPVLLEGEQSQEIHKERLANLEIELAKVRSDLATSSSRLQVIEASQQQPHLLAAGINRLALLSEKEVNRLKFFLDISRNRSQTESFQAEMPLRTEAARANYGILELVQKEQILSETYGDGHPFVEAARQEIETTRRFIRDNQPDVTTRVSNEITPTEMLATYINLLRHDIDELQKREKILLSQSRTEMALAKSVEAQFIQVESLKKQVERAQVRYDQVIHRLQELNLSKSYVGLSTDLLAPPLVADSPSWPIVPLVILIGFIGGVGVGGTLAVAAEVLDATFTSVEDLERTIGASVITHVPRMNMKKLQREVADGSNVHPSLVTFHTPRSSESEIYRVGRTSLLIAAKQAEMRTIMVTSPQPGDGKSTTISNLAISIAQTGKRVLLIDADMRRPVISSLFGITQKRGLSDALLNQCKLSDAIAKSECPNLHVMPHGSTTQEPAELLESPELSRLLSKVGSHFDLVMVDAPPVLAVTDPAIVGSLTDGVLLTVKVAKNGRGIVEDAMRVLSDVHIEPLGVVVNGVEKSASKSYQYGGYSRNKYGYVGKYHDQYQSRLAKSA